MADTPEEILSRLEKLFANRRRMSLYGKGIFPTKYQGQNSDVFVTGKDFSPRDSEGKPITYQGENILKAFAVTKFNGGDEAILLRIGNSEKFAAFCNDDSSGEGEGRTKRDIERTGKRKDKKDKFDGDIKYVFLLRFAATPAAGTDTYKVLIGGHQPRPVFVAEFTGASASACPIELLKIDNLGGKKAIVNVLLKISGGWRVYKYSVDGGSSDVAGAAIDTTATINLDYQLNLLDKPNVCLGYGFWVYWNINPRYFSFGQRAVAVLDGQLVTSDSALPTSSDPSYGLLDSSGNWSAPSSSSIPVYNYVFLLPGVLQRQQFVELSDPGQINTADNWTTIRMDSSGTKAIGSVERLSRGAIGYMNVMNYLWLPSRESPCWSLDSATLNFTNFIKSKTRGDTAIIDFRDYSSTSFYRSLVNAIAVVNQYFTARGTTPPLQYAGAEIPLDISDKKDWWFAHSLKDIATALQQPEKITIPVSWFDSSFRSKGEPIDVGVSGLPANLTSSTGGVLFAISPTPTPIFCHSSFFHSK
ncbi:MAG: hypothetical protein DCF22_00430 [Leptolyngbya sp.]|nr:MAG: hypothetical protein DCF22_00430 [Leptolyngbya sp.]